MTSLLREEKSPGFPFFPIEKSIRVRQCNPFSGSTPTTSKSISILPRRENCSRITERFNSRWALISTCWKSHPPHPPGIAYLQGATTRSFDGVIISTASARANFAEVEVISIRAFSPVIAWRTKITWPLCLATKWPPWATGPISTVTRSPTFKSRDSRFWPAFDSIGGT